MSCMFSNSITWGFLRKREVPMVHLRHFIQNTWKSQFQQQILYVEHEPHILQNYWAISALPYHLGDLHRESWISTRFKVFNRFRHHVFERHHLCQPKQFLGFRRLKIDVKRDVFRQAWVSTWHIRDTELHRHINLFYVTHSSGSVTNDRSGLWYSRKSW